MSQVLIATSVWLHAMATVIFIGYYVVLAVICLPALEEAAGAMRGAVISAISKRSRLWLYVSLVVFAVTGAYLTLADPSYMGLGNFGNPWAVLMLVKHVVIMGMIAAAFWSNAILRLGPLASSNSGGAQAVKRFRGHVGLMAAAGTLVLLLTAAAQGF